MTLSFWTIIADRCVTEIASYHLLLSLVKLSVLVVHVILADINGFPTHLRANI